MSMLSLSKKRSHSSVSLSSLGDEGTLTHRVQAACEKSNVPISFWHDVALFYRNEVDNCPTGALNFVCEIPKYSRKKFEIATDEPQNPIKQDVKKGVLREFKKGDIFFNYGCFPRTWEDPDYIHPDAGVGGDNDPLDVCEIGLRIIPTGAVRQVKVLGCLCMIDDGEADWKIIVIDVTDRWAQELNDVADVERLLPGTVSAVREWFRTYKIPDGKPPNEFGLDEKCMHRSYAMQIVGETHHAWRRLVTTAAQIDKLHLPSLADIVDFEHDAQATDLFCPELQPITSAPTSAEDEDEEAPAQDGMDVQNQEGNIEF